MQRATQKVRFEFIHLFMKHASLPQDKTEGDLQRVACLMLRHGATLGRIAEQDCNGPNTPNGLTPEQYNTIQSRWDKFMEGEHAKEERLNERITSLLAPFGCKPVFGGDPRGNTLKIQMPDGYTNDWGREGLCVPTS